MPVLFIEAPQGIRPEAKRKLVEKLTTAVDEAHQSENPKILEALKKISAGA
jgi:phenylpyruvate tautomerase PptA (4-oxalocrotonate tautomerase family)